MTERAEVGKIYKLCQEGQYNELTEWFKSMNESMKMSIINQGPTSRLDIIFCQIDFTIYDIFCFAMNIKID